jgi:collagenase-like PrtC family protease
MAVTQTDIDNLNAAIASGARSVTLGGQTVTYNTTASLIAARNDLQKQLNAARRKPRTRQLVYGGRGYQ